MTAPLDLEILRRFIDEAGWDGFGFESALSEAHVRGSLLYLVQAMLGSSWCDFSDPGDSPDSYYASTNEFLDKLPCRPLLEPWLSPRSWSPSEVTELKTSFEVAQALTR